MKYQTKNKVYDTDTAIKRAEYHKRCPKDPKYHCTEELYQTKSGDFFVYGCGYYTRCSNAKWCEKIITPMPHEKARDWAEKNIKMSEYIEIFGEPESEYIGSLIE